MSLIDCSFLFAFASLASTTLGRLETHRTLRSCEAIPADSGYGAVLRASSFCCLRSCVHDDEPRHVTLVVNLDGIACGSSAIGTFYQSSAAFDMLDSNII